MKIKELKEKIADLPDDMEIVVVYDRLAEPSHEGYGNIGMKIRKAKVKNTKFADLHTVFVQSRPFKDDSAQLMLILE